MTDFVELGTRGGSIEITSEDLNISIRINKTEDSEESSKTTLLKEINELHKELLLLEIERDESRHEISRLHDRLLYMEAKETKMMEDIAINQEFTRLEHTPEGMNVPRVYGLQYSDCPDDEMYNVVFEDYEGLKVSTALDIYRMLESEKEKLCFCRLMTKYGIIFDEYAFVHFTKDEDSIKILEGCE